MQIGRCLHPTSAGTSFYPIVAPYAYRDHQGVKREGVKGGHHGLDRGKEPGAEDNNQDVVHDPEADGPGRLVRKRPSPRQQDAGRDENGPQQKGGGYGGHEDRKVPAENIREFRENPQAQLFY